MYIEARYTPPPTPFDPDTLRDETDFIICADGSYTSASSVDHPKMGRGITVSRGHTGDEYASGSGPLIHADLVELNGATADINNVRAELVAVLEAVSWACDHADTFPTPLLTSSLLLTVTVL